MIEVENLSKRYGDKLAVDQARVRRAWARRAAVTAATGFIGISAFQLAITLGAPLGPAAYGGAYPAELPAGFRVASAVQLGVWAFASIVVLRRASILASPLPAGFARKATWVYVALLTLGTIGNFASPSEWERFGWGPALLVMTGLCIVVARSGGDEPAARERNTMLTTEAPRSRR